MVIWGSGSDPGSYGPGSRLLQGIPKLNSCYFVLPVLPFSSILKKFAQNAGIQRMWISQENSMQNSLKVKVRLSENEFMKSSISKNEPKKLKDFCPECFYSMYIGRNPSNFLVHIWKIDDFINSFWLNLTFRYFQ